MNPLHFSVILNQIYLIYNINCAVIFWKATSWQRARPFLLVKITILAAKLKTATLPESDFLVKERLTLSKTRETIDSEMDCAEILCDMWIAFLVSGGRKMRTHSSLSFKQVGHGDRSLIWNESKYVSESNYIIYKEPVLLSFTPKNIFTGMYSGN